MFARHVTIQLQPGKADETTAIFSDSVVPALQQQEGFKGALLLIDPETPRGISIALWETEADMLASETSGFFQDQIVKFAAVFAGPPVKEYYQVSVQA